MVIDTGLGVSSLRDLLDLAGDHIDHWKFGFGTSALMPLSILEEKLDLLDKRHILTYPGGTLLEAAVVQEHCRVFMTRAAELGFGAVEISEGTIDLPADRRRRMIDCARNAGLVPITEVGRKDPTRQPSAEELAEQALQDLAWGASWVIIEGRECGRGIGIYDEGGEIRACFPGRDHEAGRRRRVTADLGGPATLSAGLSGLSIWRQRQSRQHPSARMPGARSPALRAAFRNFRCCCEPIPRRRPVGPDAHRKRLGRWDRRE